MGKLKSVSCEKCGEKITRHDEKRVIEKVQTRYHFRYRTLHLICSQEAKYD